MPPPAPISSCSRIPTLITRLGCRRICLVEVVLLISASTRASRGSSSSSRVVVEMNRSRMASVIKIPSGFGPGFQALGGQARIQALI
jgi:hypothetical protein